jgi:hypothetical protein
VFVGQLTAAIREALAEQKERCAQVAKNFKSEHSATDYDEEYRFECNVGEDIAEAIRAIE